MQLSQAFHGACEAESALKAPSRGQGSSAPLLYKPLFLFFLVTGGVWGHCELSTKLDGLALLSAPLLLGPLLQLIKHPNGVHRSCHHRKSRGVRCSQHLQSSGLPLNSMEC